MFILNFKFCKILLKYVYFCVSDWNKYIQLNQIQN